MIPIDPPITLARTVRLFIAPGQPVPPKGINSFASLACTTGIGAFYEVTLHCVGPPSPRTGFVESIYEVDQAVHAVLAPRIAEALQACNASPASLLRDSMSELAQHLEARLSRVDWSLSPTYRISMEPSDMTSYLLSQQYQFAASHRLHNPEFDEATNKAVFGKCCNPNGHGHNYRLEVEVSVPMKSGEPGHGFSVLDLDATVHEHIIDPYDHTYLNLDVSDYKDCNPTVENITVICHDKLVEPLRERGVRLRRVRLWETEKTCCAYPAES